MMWSVFIDALVSFTNIFVFGYFLFVMANYIAILYYAFGLLRTYRRRQRALRAPWTQAARAVPPISVFVPMYNEAEVCVETARSMLSLRYPSLDIIMINDGSKDDTMERLKTKYRLTENIRYQSSQLPTEKVKAVYRSRTNHNLWVIDKENGGKVDALNAGLNYCRTPLFCAVDADSLLERDSLRQLVTPFLSDSRTIAAGGNVRIVNDCDVRGGHVRKVALPKKLIAQFQVLEYMRAFVAARAGWAALDMLMIISGAFGLFRRDCVAKVGGFNPDAIGEDMELIFRLHRYFRDRDEEYRIAYVPDAVAWTECPETYKVLGKQRDRWHRGLTQLLFIHKKMALNPEYGRLGLVGYPYFFLVEFLGPVFEVMGYIVVGVTVAMGWLNPAFAALLLAFALLFGFAYSLASIALEELTFRRYTRKRDVIRLIWLSVLENFGYRQMTVFWRLRGIWKYMSGDMSWGDMTRTGFQTAK